MSTPQVAALGGDVARPRPVIKCQVKVRTATGEQHSYAALFASTTDAAIDALERFGISKISEEAMS